MADIRTFDLKGKIQGGAGIEFLGAVTPEGDSGEYRGIPFWHILWSLDGVQQESGLRMDAGKQIFLDHEQFTDSAQHDVLEQAAPEIVQYVAQEMTAMSGPGTPGSLAP